MIPDATVLIVRALLLGMLMSAGPLLAAGSSSPREQEFNSVIHLKADIAHGQQLFDDCAACHGSNGTGVSDGTVPAIAGQHLRVIAWELVSFRHKVRLDPRMRHFSDEHHLPGTQDIADVAAYASRLPPPRLSSHGDGGHTARGAQIYERDCSACHGADAQGDNRKRYPRLAGQHYEYLLLQLHQAIDRQRLDFSDRHIQLLRGLAPSDLTAVCDYVSRLGE